MLLHLQQTIFKAVQVVNEKLEIDLLTKKKFYRIFPFVNEKLAAEIERKVGTVLQLLTLMIYDSENHNLLFDCIKINSKITAICRMTFANAKKQASAVSESCVYNQTS